MFKRHHVGFIKNHRVKIACWFGIFFFIAEIVRSHAIIPFPWNTLGYASGYSLSFMQFASVVGVYGLGFILYFVGTIPYTKNMYAISCVTIAVIIPTMYGNYRLNQAWRTTHVVRRFVELHVIQTNHQHHWFKYKIQLETFECLRERLKKIPNNVNH